MEKTGSGLIAFAKKFNGNKYSFGVIVPKNDEKYNGSFDCAEFAAYCNFQVFGQLYGTNTHDVKEAKIADAYTGYFQKDASKYGTIISVELAAKIPGAMLLRFPAPGAIGHIVFSQGNGKTVEANSTKYGCGEFSLNGRHFDIGILLPGVVYDKATLETIFDAPKRVYKLTTPMIKDAFVLSLQKALGFKGKALDGVFGLDTNAAVIAFQKKEGLLVDGQLTPDGETAKELGINE